MQKLLSVINFERIKYVLTNPRENPQETVILVGILIVITLILVIFSLFLISAKASPTKVRKKASQRTKWIKWITAIGLLIILVGVSVFGLIYSSNPNYCNLCHVMRGEYQSWHKSTHSQVTCLSCHQKSGPIGWSEAKIRTLREAVLNVTKNYPQPITAQIKNLSCLKCHNKILKESITVNTIKMSHKEPINEGYHCTDCHNTVAHGNKVPQPQYPIMNSCIECHNGKNVSADCNLCHTKDIGEKPSTKISNYPLVHLPPPSDCRGCHDIQKCTACHGVEMPHPADFPKPENHASLAAFEKKNVCYRCHEETTCNDCHRFPGHSANWRKEHGPKASGQFKEGCLRCHTRSEDFCGLCH